MLLLFSVNSELWTKNLKIQQLNFTNLWRNSEIVRHFCGIVDGLTFLFLDRISEGMTYLKENVPSGFGEFLQLFYKRVRKQLLDAGYFIYRKLFHDSNFVARLFLSYQNVVCAHCYTTRTSNKQHKLRILNSNNLSVTRIPMYGHYCRHCTLGKLRWEIQKKRKGKWTLHVLLQHDNARPHRSQQTSETLASLGFTVLPHPRYSSYLASSGNICCSMG